MKPYKFIFVINFADLKMEPAAAQKKALCEHCNKGHSTQYRCTFHKRNFHTEEPVTGTICTACTKRLSIKSALKGHMATTLTKISMNVRQVTKRFRTKRSQLFCFMISCFPLAKRTHTGQNYRMIHLCTTIRSLYRRAPTGSQLC